MGMTCDVCGSKNLRPTRGKYICLTCGYVPS